MSESAQQGSARTRSQGGSSARTGVGGRQPQEVARATVASMILMRNRIRRGRLGEHWARWKWRNMETEAAAWKRRFEASQAVCGLAGELLRLDDYDQMLDTLVQRSLAILAAERGFLVLAHGEALEFRVVRNWSREELEAAKDPVSRSIVAEVLHAREPILVEDALTDPRFMKSESVLRLQIRSVLAAPVLIDGQPAGALYLECRTIQRLFTSDQFELFKWILDLSSRALESCTKRLVMEQRLKLLETDFLSRHRFP